MAKRSITTEFTNEDAGIETSLKTAVSSGVYRTGKSKEQP